MLDSNSGVLIFLKKCNHGRGKGQNKIKTVRETYRQRVFVFKKDMLDSNVD